MKEETVFRFFTSDYLIDPNGAKTSIMKRADFKGFVESIVRKACGNRMDLPQVKIAQDGSELMFIVPAEIRNIFFRTYNAEIAPAIIKYLSVVAI